MERTDGGAQENHGQANALLQFAQDQCLRQYIDEPTRRNNILDVFLTNNDQLTRQIQFKKSDSGCRDLSFIDEDIN